MAKRTPGDRLLRMLIGAVVGVGLCWVADQAGVIDWMKTLQGEDFASAAVALILVFFAGFAALASTSTGVYRRVAENYREGDPLDDKVLRTMRFTAVILVLSAVLLLAPVVAAQMGVSRSVALAVAAGLAAVVAVQCWLNLRVVGMGDELSKAVNSEICVIAFWVTQLGLFMWAALTKLGLAGDVSLWTLMLICTGVTIVISIAVVVRRGMAS